MEELVVLRETLQSVEPIIFLVITTVAVSIFTFLATIMWFLNSLFGPIGLFLMMSAGAVYVLTFLALLIIPFLVVGGFQAIITIMFGIMFATLVGGWAKRKALAVVSTK